MKFRELKKIYPYDPEKEAFIVDIQLEDYRDAYCDWDFSPFVNRDLDEDLTEYLLECSYEITLKHPLVMNFHILNQAQNPVREEKTLVGMRNYFKYQMRKIHNQKIRVFKDMTMFLVVGTMLLVIGFYLNELKAENLLLSVLSEGLSIGGWVMLWEMFSAWFFDLKRVRRKIKHFQRLFDSWIVFSYNRI